MRDRHGYCCGIPVHERTGECQHRRDHPRQVTQPMLDEFWKIARQASRARRDPLLEVLEEVFARQAEARGYKPAPEMPQNPQPIPLWLNDLSGRNQPHSSEPRTRPNSTQDTQTPTEPLGERVNLYRGPGKLGLH